MTAYTTQEAVVNALLHIEGCATIAYSDLTTAEETAEADGTAGAEAEEDLKFEVCCNTRLATYLSSISSSDGCADNTGFGMEQERATRKTTETTDQSTYDNYCVSS